MSSISTKCMSVPVMVLVSLPLQAHLGDRVIPIFEITDEQLALIDIEDGSINEWEDFGEPSLTTLDFLRFGYPGGEDLDHDPSDFDFRIWLGWNGTHNRIYGSIQAADDSYRGFDDAIRVDGLHFMVDGNHSGGDYTGEDAQQPQFFSIYKEWDLHEFIPGVSVGNADTFADGLLVEKGEVVEDDSAVESVSWARIKASLTY